MAARKAPGPISDRMLAVLREVVAHEARGLRYRSSIGTTSTCMALQRRGLLGEDAATSGGPHGSHYWFPTAAGRAAAGGPR